MLVVIGYECLGETMKLLLKITVMSGLLFSLNACSVIGCEDYHSYRAAESKTPVQIPADLEQPDNESIAPVVKTADKNTIHKDASGNCLDKPPKL